MPLLNRCVGVAFLILFFVSSVATVSAQTPVKATDAVAVATNWLHLGHDQNWGWNSPTSALLPVSELSAKGELLAYCIPVSGGGYIVVPAYRELPPITAYSSTSNLNPTDEDGFAGLLKDALSYKLDLVRTVLNTPKPPVEWTPVVKEIELDRVLWQAYSGPYQEFREVMAITSGIYNPGRGRNRDRSTLDDMEPLLTTSWHQSAPYNSLCPMGDGGRSAVGCVATAAAQILAFWRYPANGIGSHSYVWNGDQSCGGSTTGQTLSADYSDSYDWTNVLNRVTNSSPQVNIDAVAEICYEAAVAVNMDFGRCGSGAYTGEVVNAFRNYFGYAQEVDREDRVSYSSAESWFAMVQEDLNLNRPIQYRIASHSIVCDAWRISGTPQLHLNYGWDDSHTAWYNVDNLYCTWSGCTPQVEYVIRRIHPIVTASIDVTAPDGGEMWAVGETHNITWTSVEVTGNVRIDINRTFPNGPWETIAADAPNTGAFEWLVTAPPCSTARARVISLTNPAVIAMSSADFSAAYPAPCVVIACDSTSHIQLSWASVGAPYYRILSGPTAAGPFDTLIGSTADMSFVDPNPLSDMKFYMVMSSSTP